MIDFDQYTDEELHTIIQDTSAELVRRESVKSIPYHMDDLNRQWMEASTDFNEGDAWIRPTGAHNAYPKDWVVTHNEKIWASNVASNVWEPGVSGWREQATTENEWPDWVQPTGGHDAYAKGSKVTHVEQHWISDVDANVWQPGVYGWTNAV